MATESGVNNAQIDYVLSLSTLYYVQAAGDQESNELGDTNKQSFIKYTTLNYLKYMTDIIDGKTRFIIIGK